MESYFTKSNYVMLSSQEKETFEQVFNIDDDLPQKRLFYFQVLVVSTGKNNFCKISCIVIKSDSFLVKSEYRILI